MPAVPLVFDVQEPLQGVRRGLLSASAGQRVEALPGIEAVGKFVGIWRRGGPAVGRDRQVLDGGPSPARPDLQLAGDGVFHATRLRSGHDSRRDRRRATPAQPLVANAGIADLATRVKPTLTWHAGCMW